MERGRDGGRERERWREGGMEGLATFKKKGIDMYHQVF